MCILHLFSRHHLDFHPWAMYHHFAWDPHLEFQFLTLVGCRKECTFSWTWHQEWVFGSHLECKVCNCIFKFTMCMSLCQNTFNSNSLFLAMREITFGVLNK